MQGLAKHRRFENAPMLAHEIGRPRFRFQNPVIPGMGEAIVQPEFDYYEVVVNTAVTRQVLFTIPQGSTYTPAGGAALTKNDYHTGMLQQGTLQAPEKLLVRAIGVMLRGNIHPTDLNLFVENTILFFTIQQKRYFVSQVSRCSSGGGPFVSGTLSGVNSAVNGWPSAGNQAIVFDGEIPGVQIEQQQNFQVVLDPTLPAAGAFTTLTTANGGFGVVAHVYLDGIKLRAVL